MGRYLLCEESGNMDRVWNVIMDTLLSITIPGMRMRSKAIEGPHTVLGNEVLRSGFANRHQQYLIHLSTMSTFHAHAPTRSHHVCFRSHTLRVPMRTLKCPSHNTSHLSTCYAGRH